MAAASDTRRFSAVELLSFALVYAIPVGALLFVGVHLWAAAWLLPFAAVYAVGVLWGLHRYTGGAR